MNRNARLLNDDSWCRRIYGSLLVIAPVRPFAFTLFLIATVFFKLAFDFAVAIPIFFLGLTMVTSMEFAMHALIFPWVCGSRH